MKELSLEHISFVSGGGGAPATASNSAGASMIIGAIAGIPFGAPGILGGTAAAGIYSAIGTIPIGRPDTTGGPIPTGMNPQCVEKEFSMHSSNFMQCR